MNRTLTAAENHYVATLARRIQHIHEQYELLRTLPLQSVHEATGIEVKYALCLLMEAAGWTDLELSAVLEGEA